MLNKIPSSEYIYRQFDIIFAKFNQIKCQIDKLFERIPINIGTGIGIYKRLFNNKFEFKSLVAGSNTTITETNNEIIISSTATPVTCEDIDDCLGISNAGAPNKFLNEQGDFITVSGFTCSDLIGCNVSNLTNDAGYATTSELLSYTLENARSAGNSLNGDINANGNRLLNLPAPASNNEPIRKIDFDSFNNSVGRQRGSIDCSGNPNYPASNIGDRWEVTAPGKIGGASGITVQIWDEIVCKATSVAGDQATVGANFYIVQGNIERATETTSGYLALATNAEAQAGTDDEKAITSLKLANWWAWVKTQAQTFAAKITFSLAPRFDSVAPGKVLAVDSNRDLTTIDVDTVPTSGSSNLISSGAVFNAVDGLKINSLQEIDIIDDFTYPFTSAVQGTALTQNTAHHSVFKSAGFAVDITTANNRPGRITLTHTSNTITDSRIFTSAWHRLDDCTLIYTYIFDISTLSTAAKTYEFVVGLFNTAAVDSGITNGVYLLYTHSQNSGRFQCKTRAGSVGNTQTNDSVVTVATGTVYKVEIVYDGVEVKFYINSALVATNTDFIPLSTSMQSGVYSFTTTNSFNTYAWSVDYIRYRKLLTTSR